MIWSLNNGTRYAAEATLGTDRDGHDIWLTVIKATFDVAADGSLRPTEDQWPIFRAPLYAGDPARSSLLADSDIDCIKLGVDVLVQGTVQGTSGAQARIVTLDVGGRRKSLRVHGEREWSRRVTGIGPSAAREFTPIPLTYEHAWGGVDPGNPGDWCESNPAGSGYAKRRQDLIGRLAPRIEYADQPIDEGAATPAGFGPIARHWLPRRSHAGTYDAAWHEQQMPLPPQDFDPRYHLAAPVDQQYEQLPHRAGIVLEGMTPQPLALQLPRLALGISVNTVRGTLHRHPLLRSVLLLTDQRKLVLTYGDALRCTGAKFSILDTEIIEKAYIQ